MWWLTTPVRWYAFVGFGLWLEARRRRLAPPRRPLPDSGYRITYEEWLQGEEGW